MKKILFGKYSNSLIFSGNFVEYTLNFEFGLHKFFFEDINNKVNKLEFKLDKLGHRLKEYIKNLTYKREKIAYASCAATIENMSNKMGGVENVSVNF